MKVKPVVARELANHDIDEIIDYYMGESADQAAYGFIDALEDAYAHIGRHPATGSPRYAHELDLHVRWGDSNQGRTDQFSCFAAA